MIEDNAEESFSLHSSDHADRGIADDSIAVWSVASRHGKAINLELITNNVGASTQRSFRIYFCIRSNQSVKENEVHVTADRYVAVNAVHETHRMAVQNIVDPEAIRAGHTASIHPTDLREIHPVALAI